MIEHPLAKSRQSPSQQTHPKTVYVTVLLLDVWQWAYLGMSYNQEATTPVCRFYLGFF